MSRVAAHIFLVFSALIFLLHFLPQTWKTVWEREKDGESIFLSLLVLIYLAKKVAFRAALIRPNRLMPMRKPVNPRARPAPERAGVSVVEGARQWEGAKVGGAYYSLSIERSACEQQQLRSNCSSSSWIKLRESAWEWEGKWREIICRCVGSSAHFLTAFCFAHRRHIKFDVFVDDVVVTVDDVDTR